MPNKVNVTVASNVPGMLLWIEGSPYRAPATVMTWADNPLTVMAPDQIGPDDQPYIYKSWSDGGRRSHEYIAPGADATVTANFNLLPGDAFAPHADARVSESNPTRNYGLSTGLSVKGGTSSDYETLIRFKVSGVGDRVFRARLYLYAYDPSVDGPSIYTTSSNWRETGITWNTRPAPTSGQIDNYGQIADNSGIAYDVTSAISGDGYVTFPIRGSSSDAARGTRARRDPPAEVGHLVERSDSGRDYPGTDRHCGAFAKASPIAEPTKSHRRNQRKRSRHQPRLQLPKSRYRSRTISRATCRVVWRRWVARSGFGAGRLAGSPGAFDRQLDAVSGSPSYLQRAFQQGKRAFTLHSTPCREPSIPA